MRFGAGCVRWQQAIRGISMISVAIKQTFLCLFFSSQCQQMFYYVAERMLGPVAGICCPLTVYLHATVALKRE